MQRLIRSFVVAIVVFVTSSATHAPDREPEQVVRDYIAAFKSKDKARMLSCLSTVFLDNYKTQYLSKLAGYEPHKLRLALSIYGVDSIDQMKPMSGEAILSKFLDSPASDAYWQGFDSADLIMDVEKVEVHADRAIVRSWLYTKASLPVKVETTYSLAKRNGAWQIDQFQKKTIKP